MQDAFFRRRTGSRWLSQTKSASTSRTGTNEASFEVEVSTSAHISASGTLLTVLRSILATSGRSTPGGWTMTSR